MPTIKSIETMLVQLPTRREHKWAGLTEVIGRYVIVKVTDSDGRVGWGEAPALKDWGGEFGRYFGESAAITRTVIDQYLAPAVIGVDLGDMATLHARMDAIIKGYPYSKAAVEFAVYDVTGRWLDVPVHILLGGKARDRVPVTHSIGLISIEEAVAETRKLVAEGIRTIKVKVGVDPERDVKMVHAVRDAAGDAVDICIDANEGYKTPGEAVQIIRQIEECRLKYVEQPVMGIERISTVARRIDAPVMADESAWNAHDVVQILAENAVQIVSIYTTKAGGLYKAMQVGAVCQAAGIICNVNGSIETGIGNLANVQLAAASPAVTLSCVIPVSVPASHIGDRVGGIYYKDDFLTEPMGFEDGAIVVPSGPGMGIDVDMAKLEKYRVQD
ncbi:mandelate racemase/muconate lactonizing enzyme family protein [Cucumibacter marinus]|uniref:mandelate racemase/muconate lactonizing enzyme family protein n=1 Tax=Cucumibacter marinus TaxID=1121252 RepID=UPI00040157BE|nr:enolase C-terminal domain-like protein [Cucumibacter marinus]